MAWAEGEEDYYSYFQNEAPLEASQEATVEQLFIGLILVSLFATGIIWFFNQLI